MGLSKKDIAELRGFAKDTDLPADERALYANLLKEAGVSAEATEDEDKPTKKKPKKGKKKPKAKKKPKMSAESLDKAKKSIKDKTGKTEAECEKIIEQYRSLRTKAQSQKKKQEERTVKGTKRIKKLKDEGDIIEGTNVKTATATLETTKDDVKVKIDAEIKVIEDDAKKDVKKVDKPKKEKDAIVDDKVKAGTKKMGRKLGVDTSAIISAITSSLASHSKDDAKAFLIKLRSDVDKLIKKYVWGGSLNYGVEAQTLNIAQNQSASSVNPSKFAKGGGVDKHEILVYYGQKPTRAFMSWDYSDEEAYDRFIDIRSENIKENDVVLVKNDEEIDFYDSEQDRLEDEDYAKGGLTESQHHQVLKDIDALKEDLRDDKLRMSFGRGSQAQYASDMVDRIESLSAIKRQIEIQEFAEGGYTEGDYSKWSSAIEKWTKAKEKGDKKEQEKQSKIIDSITKNYARGGITSAIMRERKYVSKEKHEQSYSKGTNRPSYKKRKKAKGGWIQSVVNSPNFKKGAFTAKSKKHDMTTTQFMNEVLNNPSKFDEKTRRQAQFMKNV